MTGKTVAGCAAVLLLGNAILHAQEIVEESGGRLVWTNGLSHAVYQVEWASSLESNDWTATWDSLTGIQSDSEFISVAVPRFFRVSARQYNEIVDRTECYRLYSNALLNAKEARPDEVVHGLWPVSTNTPGTEWRLFTNWVDHTTSLWVKVAALKWTGNWAWNNLLTNGPITMSGGWCDELWVTLVPELRDVCAAYQGSDPLLRMEKALGLPPRTGNYGVAEFFVDPKYLFRPAPDPDIQDTSAGLAPDDTSPLLSANSFQGRSTGYAAWYADTYRSRGYAATNSLDNCYPWTRLGYTYDYENAPNNPVGLSEYVIPDPSQSQYWGEGLAIPIFVETRVDAELYGR